MRRTRSLLGTLTAISLLAALIPLGAFPVAAATVVINEVDSDTGATETGEFVELYDGGVGNTALDGLVLVLHDGLFDWVYASLDLDGVTTDANGYAVICATVSASFLPNCDVNATFEIRDQSETDHAVALYSGNSSDFRGNSALHTNGLLDAVSIGTGADEGLRTLLNPGQLEIDEAGGGDIFGHSNQRCPNGAGGLRNTDAYAQFAPTVGAANTCAGAPTTTTTTTTTTTQPTTTTLPPTTTSSTTTTTTTLPPTTTTTTAPPATPQPSGSGTADRRPPRVHAELDRISGWHNEGWYRVDFECWDRVDRRPRCVATLNGVQVRDGQKVHLIRKAGPSSSVFKGHVLHVRANSFVLEVTGTDRSGNVATDTAQPSFWRGRYACWRR